MKTVNELDTKQHTLDTVDGPYSFEGVQLGFGTSRRGSHLHRPDSPPRPGVRCSGCRWTDTTIFWSAGDQKYIVHIVGRSILAGERDKVRTVWADEADDVLDGLLISAPRHVDAPPGTLELPQPNAHALEEAAERDPRLADVMRAWRDND